MKIFFLICRLFLILLSCPIYCLKVAVFNVGQGNCTVITAPNKPTLIVDAGSSQFPTACNGESYKDLIIENVIEHIESHSGQKELAIIVSHPDIDHGNWMNAIASPLIDKNFKVIALLGGTRQDYKDRSVKLWPFINELEEKCRKHEFTFRYCNEVKNIQEFCREHLPSYCSILSAKHTAKDNDKSIVVRVAEEDFSILLPGDATHAITDSIPKNDLKSDVLVLAHHGAHREGCTNLDLLKKVDPDYVIASSGMNKSYHHVPGQIVALLASFYRNRPHDAWHHHTINYYDDGNLKAEKRTNQVKQIITYNSGFATGITTFPILTTTTADDIIIENNGDEYTLVSNQKPDISPTSLALESLNMRYFTDFQFNTIAKLNLRNLQLSDADIKTHFKKLPAALTFANFSDNNLTLRTAKHFIKLLKLRETETKIVLNVPYKKSTKEKSPLLQSLVDKFRKRAPAEVRTLKHLKREEIEEEYKTIGLILPKAAKSK